MISSLAGGFKGGKEKKQKKKKSRGKNKPYRKKKSEGETGKSITVKRRW